MFSEDKIIKIEDRIIAKNPVFLIAGATFAVLVYAVLMVYLKRKK